MTKKQLSEQEKAEISAFLDAEQSLSDFMAQPDATDTLQRYAMIGDVMRADEKDDIFLDIADKVAAQLEHEPIFADFSKEQTIHHQPKPDQHQSPEQDSKAVSLNWKKPLTQVAIAASVALFAIVGVQTLPTNDNTVETLPQLQTTPFAGQVAPVSYSSEQPALQNAANGLRELQQQRIGALISEHQRQTRITTANSNKKTADNDVKKENQ